VNAELSGIGKNDCISAFLIPVKNIQGGDWEGEY